ncbi:MAG: hypothetical protein Ct9H300mP23_11300 [Nitrospinota bacterium]|nr:MAG: hypothetical protein Ct9H300mP23_11300 [Nitrospinota bacterium]
MTRTPWTEILLWCSRISLYPHMSVFNNMAYGLKIAGLPKSEIPKELGKEPSCWNLMVSDPKPENYLVGRDRELLWGVQ